MKSTTGWNSPNIGATNESGFTGLPGGSRDDYGSYGTIGYYGSWWISTEAGSLNAWANGLSFIYSDVNRNINYRQHGFSVRCLRD